MLDIRKTSLLLLFIGISFSFAVPSHDLNYCVPCLDDFQYQSCPEHLNHGNGVAIQKISIEKDFGQNNVLSCIPCSNISPGQDVSVLCSKLVEFPNISVQPQLVQNIKEDELTCTPNKVFHEGQCRRLLEQENCAEGQWLVETNNKYTCVDRPCPLGQIIFNNTCIFPIDTDKLCYHTGEDFEIYTDGTAGCFCSKDYIRDPSCKMSSCECHLVRSQGPCESDWMIFKLDDLSPVCVPYFCPNPYTHVSIYDESVNRTTCVKKSYSGHCPANVKLIKSSSASCSYDVHTHNVFSEAEYLGPSFCFIDLEQRVSYLGKCVSEFVLKRRKP